MKYNMPKLHSHIDDYIKGWLVGSFDNNLISNKDIEVAIKYYNKGTIEKKHYHKLALEYTIIIKGSVSINDVIYNEKNIIEINKHEVSEFKALEDTITLVIKTPSVLGDKYEVD